MAMTKEVKGLLFLGALGGLAYYLFRKPASGSSSARMSDADLQASVNRNPFVAAPGAVNAPLSETHPLVAAPRADEADDRGQVPTPTYDDAAHLYIPDAGSEGPSMDPNDFRYN